MFTFNFDRNIELYTDFNFFLQTYQQYRKTPRMMCTVIIHHDMTKARVLRLLT